MAHITHHLRGPVTVAEYRCTAEPGDRPYWEQYGSWSLACVRRGSFGCQCRGKRFDLVPGSLLVGRPGDEYRCSHEHAAGGDLCLSVHLAPALADELDPKRRAWVSGALPPLAQVIPAAELLHASASGASDVALDEAGLLFAAQFVRVAGDQGASRIEVSARERARIVDTALRIAAQPGDAHTLQRLASEAHWSPYHYLRRFAAVLGVTPHQYIVRCRIGRAARLLAQSEQPITELALEAGFADLSNFVRSFRRAAGVSPRAWRQRARAKRKIVQVPQRTVA